MTARCSYGVSRNDSFKKLVTDLSENTSMHGIGHITRHISWWRKLFWFIVTLGAFGVYVWQVVLLFMNYYAYPTSTSVRVELEPSLTFPAVTICNMNPYRQTEVQNIYNNNANSWNTSTQHGSADPATKADALLFYEISKLGKTTRTNIGHDIYTMLLDCTYEGIHCDETNFTQFINPVHGNCFIFNSAVSRDVQQAKRPGFNYGLVLKLFVQQHEYMPLTSDTAGVKLLIHDHHSMPFPDEEGILLSPGTATDIGVKKHIITRVSAPYGNCQAIHDPVVNAKLNMYSGDPAISARYSTWACYKTCYQKVVIQRCQCCDPLYTCEAAALKGLTNVTNSRGYAYGCDPNVFADECIRVASNEFYSNALQCNLVCPPPCQEVLFDKESSIGLWPSDVLMNETFTQLVSKTGAYYMGIGANITSLTQAEKDDYLRGNVLKMSVYYNTMLATRIKTFPTYSRTDLISAFGGQTGLWLGFSVITFVEWWEFIVDIFALILLKLGSSGMNRVKQGERGGT